jgi:hypothetical protein
VKDRDSVTFIREVVEFIKSQLSLATALLIPEHQIDPFVQVQTHLLTLQLLSMGLDEVVPASTIAYAFAYPSGNSTLFTRFPFCCTPKSNSSQLMRNSGR